MTPRMRTLQALAMVVFAGGIACGGSDGGSGPGRSGLKTVLLDAVEFQPATVSISAGDTIVWSWKQGSQDHNVISSGAPSFPNEGNPVAPGTGTQGTDFFDAPHSYQYIFNAAGTYAYYCSTHGTPTTGMHGTVVVSP